MRRGEEVKDDFESRFSTNHHCCSLFRFNRPAASIYMYNIVMPTDLCYLLPFVQLQTKPREDDALFSDCNYIHYSSCVPLFFPTIIFYRERCGASSMFDEEE